MSDDDLPTLSPAERLAGEKEYAKELFETEFKAIGYLLTANGAGLIGCLSVLKEYSSMPQLHGIGIFIVLFSLGFIAAIFAFMTAQQHRGEIMGIFLGRKPSRSLASIVWTAQIPQLASGLALGGAVLGIMFKFGKL